MTQVRLDADVARSIEEQAQREDVSVAKLVNRILRSKIRGIPEPGPSPVNVEPARPNARVSVAGVRHTRR